VELGLGATKKYQVALEKARIPRPDNMPVMEIEPARKVSIMPRQAKIPVKIDQTVRVSSSVRLHPNLLRK
jgi:hypothetical protein